MMTIEPPFQQAGSLQLLLLAYLEGESSQQPGMYPLLPLLFSLPPLSVSSSEEFLQVD